MQAVRFKDKNLFYLDQTKLPSKEVWRRCSKLEAGYQAIKELRVRGAPLIGVFAAYCVCIHLDCLSRNKNIFFSQLKKSLDYLRSSRPTAVNLFWALDRLAVVALQNKQKELSQIKKLLIKEAELIHRQDQLVCQKLSDYGSTLIEKKDIVLTHCNTGYLATSGQGTALGIIYQAKKQGKGLTVYATETRPLLQGSRLTAWELAKKKIKYFLITDSTAAFLMRQNKIDKVFVGADRITASGETANKIGTYGLAVLSRYHRIPFYVAAPASTFDLNLNKGADIIIEQRNQEEVRKVLGKSISPRKAKCVNFAFDVTPSRLITAIVTEKGIIYPPYKKNIKKLIQC